MPLADPDLREIVLELLTRPGHEKVRALAHRLLTGGLGAKSTEIDFERRLPEVHGRTDALLGYTVFEFKTDLRRETKAAEEELTRYLADRERETGERFVGIATDGVTFVPYKLRGGGLRRLAAFTPSADAPHDLLASLSAAVAIAADLPPDPDTVRRELGRGSLAWHVARDELAALWAEVSDHPDVRLKRELWARLLEHVYGSSVDTDDLFFQHTYLTTVAKTMAVHVLGLDMPQPGDLLAGRPFSEAGITGAVESDFFDWPLAAGSGPDLVRRIATQAARFRLRDVQTDVLKGLYESLIDPEQRHELGEYYTPDWLAARMCEHAIERPLEQRVLDPACGSGTFLFHAVRGLLAAADAAAMPSRDALTLCCDHVRGIDVHPVAVQIARVTYLLALGEERLRDRPPLAIPVYMGDSLQWNTSQFMTKRDVEIDIPQSDYTLDFPFAVAQDPAVFGAVITRMLALSEQDAAPQALQTWLQREQRVDPGEIRKLTVTYRHLRSLKRAGRNHIWGFVARNLVRPAWLSRDDQKPDVIIGNPPWLSYRFMSRDTQKAFRQACQECGIWAGGKVATHQDLSAYFFARCVELYFKLSSIIAFVMPYAAMSRRQFEGFRKGTFGRHKAKRNRGQPIFIRFSEAWGFPDDVQPLFPVPSCVLIARIKTIGQSDPILPVTISAASGTLPRRNATPEEADGQLTWRDAPWPALSDDETTSPYRDTFRQGATMVPRVLCVVEPAPVGSLGADPAAPVVQSRRTAREKPPWKTLPPLRGNVEAPFLRPLYLGESIAPFRLLQPLLAVIPWDQSAKRLLDADAAQRAGHIHLARWLADAERLWRDHGRSRMTFQGQLDYYGKLTSQFPAPSLRLLYTKAGTLPAAALLRDASAVVDHKLYWARLDNEHEATYLLAILNSETARARVEHLQSRGQWGARDFDKVMFSLPIPPFDPKDRLHQRLARAAQRAADVAAKVPLRDGDHFVRARQRIREALREDGVGQEIDRLVAELL
ncbi:MAG: N-6 DNA methylase [Chloroflexi bacterium]|nr:N-6 DNA methylase [Chloroflexota bacterium]